MDNNTPQILAPAGNKASFLAAIAAGADAVYCGLKNYSARMEAKNFTIDELAPLCRLAHENGVKVYVALNSLLKHEDLSFAAGLIAQLSRQVKPDGLIIQDLALIDLAKQTGFKGELHLSTLSNVTFPAALKLVRENLDIDRVVIPRELSVDEIKALAAACPESLSLELFIHGALCYGISGRCYWSSYFGGKSGLRGRCVQPCRRIYSQKGKTGRFFSCVDLSLDVLSKVLLPVSKISAWKIEGRKKGPHYVYYTVSAYKLFRDQGSDPAQKKNALELLSRSLGRKGTHYNFLPQRPQNPVSTDSQTGSGLLIGKVCGPGQNPWLSPNEELLPKDLLRIGYEDEVSHNTLRVGKFVPKRGRLYIKPVAGSKSATGSYVFLTDRREKALEEMISELDSKIKEVTLANEPELSFAAKLPGRFKGNKPPCEVNVHRNNAQFNKGAKTGLWLDADDIKGEKINDYSCYWWLPPVTWPDEEKQLKENIDFLIARGSKNFVLNVPWQIALFDDINNLNIWAGPFCNIANVLALKVIQSLGFSGAIASPELGRDDYLNLIKNSPLPLGIVISGNWPLSISRTLSSQIQTDYPFISPKGEHAWATKYGSNFWIYPNWSIDLTDKKDELIKAGYSMFVNIVEPLPAGIIMKKREGKWNWGIGLA
ncbi:MAG: U32 family peptidase [Desulfobacterium sp.]|nr:U32 family peptidase [Desulfobacterium sp.]MBU3949694.1 U32 family peptidase [Pseudomonadota bacterium]MBU4035552.1 U32 family peptidase [Pseudomonadota bacterium]